MKKTLKLALIPLFFGALVAISTQESEAAWIYDPSQGSGLNPITPSVSPYTETRLVYGVPQSMIIAQGGRVLYLVSARQLAGPYSYCIYTSSPFDQVPGLPQG